MAFKGHWIRPTVTHVDIRCNYNKVNDVTPGINFTQIVRTFKKLWVDNPKKWGFQMEMVASS